MATLWIRRVTLKEERRRSVGSGRTSSVKRKALELRLHFHRIVLRGGAWMICSPEVVDDAHFGSSM